MIMVLSKVMFYLLQDGCGLSGFYRPWWGWYLAGCSMGGSHRNSHRGPPVLVTEGADARL